MADELLSSPSTAEPWYQFLDVVDRCLDDESYVWSWGTLTAIRDTVLATRRVTDGQVLALQRITACIEFEGE